MKEKRLLKLFAELRIFLLIIIVLTLLNMYVFTLSSVSGASMKNTLFERDIIVLNKVFNPYTSIDYGDVIVFVEDRVVNDGIGARASLLWDDVLAKFSREDLNSRLVKRVIAKAGDKVVIADGEIYINDVKLEEPYVNQMTAKGDIDYPLVVPESSYFVLGDNREISRDSRSFGVVDAKNIEGRVAFRLFPLTGIGRIR